MYQVMQKIEQNESHDGRVNRADPDWFLVYQYLAALLRDDELPDVGQIGVYRVGQKSIPLKFFAVFSATDGNFSLKFYRIIY